MVQDIFRLSHPAAFEDEHHGSRATDILLLGGVFIGTAEGRPMNASKLSTFVGVPRATVIRRMAELEGDGLVRRVGAAYVFDFAAAAGRPRYNTVSAELQRVVLRTATALSKLDT